MMKRSPEMQRLEEILRSSKFAAGGFLGNDPRPIEEILADDAAALAATGRTFEEVVARMREIGARAEAGLGQSVAIDGDLEARVLDSRGMIPCPWPHADREPKTVIIARRNDREIRWSALSVHMIEEHGFFEGRGAAFRLEPRELIELLF